MSKAFSYTRMSTAEQLKGDSLRRQLELSRAYAAANGLTLVEADELQDIGVSAYRGANVAEGALGRFLEAVKSKKIEAGSFLLIESLDRLSRQAVLKSLGVFTDLINSGVKIVTLADQKVYTADTDFADLIVSIVTMSRGHEEFKMKSVRSRACRCRPSS
jgi:DNA invertase Pin-like site-specific DNA recombinase